MNSFWRQCIWSRNYNKFYIILVQQCKVNQSPDLEFHPKNQIFADLDPLKQKKKKKKKKTFEAKVEETIKI